MTNFVKLYELGDDAEAEPAPFPREGESHLDYSMRVLRWAHCNGSMWIAGFVAELGVRLHFMAPDHQRSRLVKLFAEKIGAAPDLRRVRSKSTIAAKIVRRRRKAGAR